MRNFTGLVRPLKKPAMAFSILLFCLLPACVMAPAPRTAGAGIVESPPVVFVHPLNHELYRGARLAVLPFAGENRELGMNAAAVFRDIFLASGLFKAVFVVDKQAGTRARARAVAGDADLVVFARINRAFIDGGVGGAGLDVSLRILHGKSGDTVWYMRQSVERPVRWPRKDFGARLGRAFSPQAVLAPAPAAVLPNMLTVVARDMARVMADRRRAGI